ncbi:MAG: hypothetical protein MJ181_09445 [Treponema sp.]|nr:hypothetical protein [Treponema sp.]
MDFAEKMKDLFGKSAEASKVAMNKAGNAIQEFSDKTVLKIEMNKLEFQKKEAFEELGEIVFGFIDSLPEGIASNEKVVSLKEKISGINAEIEKKEKALSDLEGKASDK